MALQHLRSGTANKRPIPTVMSAGQLAINTNEGSPGLFFKDSNGDLVKVGPVHIGTSAPNSSPDSVAATALVTGTVYQILTVGNSDFTLVGASANTVGTIFTATGTTTGTGTVSGQQGNEKGEQWLDTTGSAFDLKIYDGTAWRSQAGEFVNVTGDTMTGAFGVVAGTASAPGVFFSGDTNTGLLAPAADSVAVTTGGTQRVVVDASGNVGIGTASASNTLSLEGGGTGLSINSTNDEVKKIEFKNSGTTVGYFGSSASSPARFLSSSAGELMRIDSSGRVGIGESSPDTLLHLASTNTGAGPSNAIRLTDNDTAVTANQVCGRIEFETKDTGNPGVNCQIDSIYTGSGGGSALQIRTGFAGSLVDALRIDSSGNVGIGTSSPSAMLHISKTVNSGDVGLIVQNTGTSSNTASIYLNKGSGAEPDHRIQNDTGGNLTFARGTNESSYTEQMRIDSSGRVGIGTSAPLALLDVAVLSSGARRLLVSYADSLITLQGASSSGANENLRLAGNNLLFSTGTSGGTGTERMQIDSSGNLNFSQEASSNYPEQKLKWSNDSTTTNGFYISQDSSRNGRVWHEQGLDILFGTNNTERLRIDSSGRVGIGTSSPDQVLSIHASGANPAYLHSTNGSSGSGVQNGVLIGLGDATNVYYWNYEAGAHIWATNATERMRIDSSGNVGIGNSSPTRDAGGTKSLAIGNNTMAASLDLYGNTKNYAIFSGNVGQLGFYNLSDNTERMRIDSSGRLLVGTTTEGAVNADNLTINDPGDAGITIRSSSTNAGSLFFSDSTTGAGEYAGYLQYDHGSNYLAIGTNATERMRIHGTGATKCKGSGAGYFTVDTIHEWAVANVGNWIGIMSNQTSSSPFGLAVQYTAASPSNTSNFFYYAADTVGAKFQVMSNGGVSNFQSNNSNLCDEREKKNIVSLDPKWDKVKNWELRKFHYNEDADTDDLRYGVIAQEVEIENPELITDFTKQQAEDAVFDEDGNVVTPAREAVMRKGVKEQQMMWMAIKALQEAMTKIETLEAKVAALEAG